MRTMLHGQGGSVCQSGGHRRSPCQIHVNSCQIHVKWLCKFARAPVKIILTCQYVKTVPTRRPPVTPTLLPDHLGPLEILPKYTINRQTLRRHPFTDRTIPRPQVSRSVPHSLLRTPCSDAPTRTRDEVPVKTGTPPGPSVKFRQNSDSSRALCQNRQNRQNRQILSNPGRRSGPY